MSSGCAVVDRRVEYARALIARGDVEAALDLFEQTLELVPNWASLRYAYGEASITAGRQADAVAAFRECLRLDPADKLGASLRLALLGDMPPPPACPPAYIESLFDDYAGRFDEALQVRLNYRVPEMLERVLLDHRPAAVPFAQVLDLGCGTGLIGERLHRHCLSMTGVDLSANMLDQARRKHLYRRLEHVEIEAFLAEDPDRYDLVTLGDVLVYLGEIDWLLPLCAARMVEGGLLALSAQAHDADGWSLGSDRRYAHGRRYLADLAALAGLAVVCCERCVLREDRGRPVDGFMLLLERPAPKPHLLDCIPPAEPLRDATAA